MSLYSKLVALPDHLQAEVSAFIDLLSAREDAAVHLNKPTFGSGRGMFIMKPDFDDPLEDFNDYMS